MKGNEPTIAKTLAAHRIRALRPLVKSTLDHANRSKSRLETLAHR